MSIPKRAMRDSNPPNRFRRPVLYPPELIALVDKLIYCLKKSKDEYKLKRFTL